MNICEDNADNIMEQAIRHLTMVNALEHALIVMTRVCRDKELATLLLPGAIGEVNKALNG